MLGRNGGSAATLSDPLLLRADLSDQLKKSRSVCRGTGRLGIQAGADYVLILEALGHPSLAKSTDLCFLDTIPLE
jgi:hypothetical protein